MTIKNTSSEVISDLMVLERFPEYLDITDLSYTGGVDGNKTKKSFMLDATNADTGIIDLRSLKLSPGQTYTLTYQGTMRSFTFGRFDVGYLEDSLDPNTGLTIDKEDIRTIQSEALKRESIPEREFYNHDNYGDIRFNPNETCGGPILLWRSHNTYERTYHKTIIVREVEDPEKNAVEATKDPTSLLASDSLVSDLTDPAALATRVREAQDDLKKTQADSDGDRIPDVSDDDHGDFFELKQNGNSMSLVIGANIDGMIDQIS